MSSLECPIIWAPLSEEIKPFLKYCRGLVLNAGSGKRELELGERELNIDIVPDTEPDIIGDLHSIPLVDEAVDTIVSIAVLEHTKFPWIVAQEFYRILKPGGYGVIAVPFIQPQHACPDDYCRFTENGLIELSKYSGFEVIETAHVHHFGQTVAWLLWEYLQENMPQNNLVLKLWLWLIRQLSKGNFLASDSSNTHNTHYVVVRKPGVVHQTAEAKVLLKDRSKTWFFPLLSCPNTRQTLHLKDRHLVSEDGSFTYTITKTRPILLPNTDPRTWRTIISRDGTTQQIINPVASSVAKLTAAESMPVAVVQNDAEATVNIHQLVVHQPALNLLSEQAFEVSFKSPFAEQLKQANPSKIAVLATNEYEGIFKNGGIGTHYKTLSEQLAKNGWHVILFLCTYDQSYGGTSHFAAINNIFSIQEVCKVLVLQPAHELMLEQFSADWIQYQSFCCLLFAQAISKLFRDRSIYIEFHEMYGAGYHTIQAKQSNLLGEHCAVGVTMHSGCEWIYEANEWFAGEYPTFYRQLCDYEQFTFENADLAFFPSHYLKEKVQSYGWQVNEAKHMPYFISVLDNSLQLGASVLNESVVSAALSHPRGKVPVIFFGRMEMRKGIMTFVEAIKLLGSEIREQIHVHFVGKVVRLHASKLGDLESDRYVQQELEDKITYTLHPDFYSDQAIQFIRTLKNPIVCLASHQENFPNTGLEMGQLPVSLVVSDTGGFRETLKFVNRADGIYWFKPTDSVALAEMVSKAFFNQPEVPETPTMHELEATNAQLWNRKLDFIETALNQAADQTVQPSSPKVTIGITCYNLGKYLMDCLISVASQSYDNLEVIVLDDASPDLETHQVLEQAKSIFPTYEFVRAETNLRLGNARNRLIEMAKGDYFLPLDADNRLPPFSIEKFVEAALNSQAEIVISAMLGFGAVSFLGSFKNSSIPALLQMNISGDACSLFSTALLRKFKHPERRDCSTHDWCVVAASIATGAKILHYPYPLYEYRMREDSMIKQASFDKERYYLRQYLAKIPASDWSPRQIYMMMTSIQELNAQKEQLHIEKQQAQAETLQARTELEEIRQKLRAARGNLRAARESLEHNQLDLQHSNTRISAMETSKFWMLRKGWFKLKKQLNLPSNE